MLDVIIPLVIGIAIGAIGVCVWVLSTAKKGRGEDDERDH